MLRLYSPSPDLTKVYLPMLLPLLFFRCLFSLLLLPILLLPVCLFAIAFFYFFHCLFAFFSIVFLTLLSLPFSFFAIAFLNFCQCLLCRCLLAIGTFNPIQPGLFRTLLSPGGGKSYHTHGFSLLRLRMA